MGNEHYKNLSLADMVGEEWRDIKDFEGYYQVSNMGRIKSFRCRKEKILKLYFATASNHYEIKIYMNGKKYKYIIARLVYYTFCELEENKFVLHKDHDVSNNYIDNLYLGGYDELSNTLSSVKKKKSDYRGVCVAFSMSVVIKNKIFRHYFGSEIEAAKKYDYYVKKYNLNRELNFPDEK